ncbi:hypothetical protein ALC57_04730 [Trachymyrmex cornetzi]|uniref:Uncharacterized protein n=1 Tax=Trachymyrmex cornetzi TaxID=471704 RepID=A0A195EDR4_9HYME|nr:hypothetical protein ALC57_04730 [Trachymyrmex cornetzi]
MYHARISIFKNRRSNERKKEKKRKKSKKKIRQRLEGRQKEDGGDDEEEADTWRSDVAKRDLERPGNERLVSRLQLIVQRLTNRTDRICGFCKLTVHAVEKKKEELYR